MLAVERRGRVLVATLARPPVNAIDGALLARLDAIVTEVEADAGISLLHLRSAQKSFCAGADLALMRACMASPGGTETMVGVVRDMQRVFARMAAAPFVTLAEIGGAALGGGLELALLCDLRVAAPEASFAACDFFRPAALRCRAPCAAALSIQRTSARCSSATFSWSPSSTAERRRRVYVLIVET